MGFLKNIGASFGQVDENLIRTGIPARGLVVECKESRLSVGGTPSAGSNRVCDVTVEVSGVPGHEPYRASCKHPIPFAYLAQMQSPGAVVAVRVDANDPQHIALDLDHEAPADGGAPAGSVSIATPDGNVDVPTHASPVKAGELLARGISCRAKLLMSTPLGQRNDAGLDVMGLVFTVAAADGTPYQCQIGVGVPADAVPLLYPNSDLPARALEEWLQHPAQPDMVTIDWATAMTEHAGS